MNKAVIMAGGFGTRLRPLTNKIPKPMVPIINIPMMEHIVNLLKNNGITKIVSVLYFQPEVISNHFGDGSKFGIEMQYVLANADYGTAGAVKNAFRFLDERFIIISGDVLTDFNLNDALNFHIEKKAQATILLTRVPAPLQYGIVMTDSNSKIERFLEKPSWGQVFSDTINTGIYILEPEVLDYIPYQEEFDFSKDLYPYMLSNDLPLYGYIAEGYWKDVGNLNEYQLGQIDALYGNVDLGFNQDKNNAKIGKNCNIHESVKLLNNVVIGDNVTIGEGTIIANTVIGSNCTIGNDCQLTGVTLWDDVKIADHALVKECVICNNVVIGNNTTVSENIFIAENCQIGDDVLLLPNIKLWPNKKVQSGATLSISLVQEEKWSKELFTDARISGLSNIEMNPEFGAKLGAAMGMPIPKNLNILASRDPDNVSRIMKRSITAGLLSVGIRVNDLQVTSIPQTRQELQTGKYEGGFHVRKSPRNPENIDVIIFSKDGRDITINDSKKIERFFFGEDINRVPANAVGKISYPERTNEIYIERFIQSLDVDLIRSKNFKLLIDYAYGLASRIFPMILGRLSADALSLHDYVDADKFNAEPDYDDNNGNDEMSKIMKLLNYDRGFRLEPGAEKINFIDHNGKWYNSSRLLTLITKLFLESNKNRNGYKIAVSIAATSEIEMIAKEYGVEVDRIKNTHSDMMEASRNPDYLFIGGIYGGYIFPEFLHASDGMFTIAKMLEMIAKTGFRMSQLDALLPKRVQIIKDVHCQWDAKGTVMRKAMEYSIDKERQLIEGIKIFEENNSILLLPSKEIETFSIFAESDSDEEAIKLLEKYSNLINTWSANS